MNALWIDLTPDQQQALRPFMDELRSAEAAGMVGAVVAQVYGQEMKVVYLPKPKALALNRALLDAAAEAPNPPPAEPEGVMAVEADSKARWEV